MAEPAGQDVPRRSLGTRKRAVGRETRHFLLAGLAITLLALPVRAQTDTPTAAAPTAEPAPVQLRARAEPNSVTVGTPFRYLVEIVSPPEIELIVPLLGERIGDFFVNDFGDLPPHAEHGQTVTTRWFKLVAYSPGEKTIPGFPIKYRLPGDAPHDVTADEVRVTVESLLAKQPPASDIHDIAPPIAVPRNWRPVMLAGGGVAALAALVAALYFGLNRRRAAAAPPPPPPHEVALRALAALRGQKLLEAGAYEEYYVALSNIVRAYLENRFGLHAPEMTTEEFLLAMQRDRRLTADHRSLLGTFLTQSDLVKFARHHPTLEDAERAYAAARRFVEESRLGPSPEEVRHAAA